MAFPSPNILDPTQQKGREKRAYADFRRRLRAIDAEIQERVVDQLQPREIAVNGLRAYLLNAEKVCVDVDGAGVWVSVGCINDVVSFRRPWWAKK